MFASYLFLCYNIYNYIPIGCKIIIYFKEKHAMITSKQIYETYLNNRTKSNTLKYDIVMQNVEDYLYKLDCDAEKGIEPFPQIMTAREFVDKFSYDNSPIGWVHTAFKNAKCKVLFYDERSGFLGLKKTRMAKIVSCR